VADRLSMTMHDVHRMAAWTHAPHSLDQGQGRDERSAVDLLHDPQAEGLFDRAARDALRTRLAAAMETLTDRERRLLELRYGWADGQSRSLAELVECFSVSRERIRQIEQMALEKIRRGEHAGPLETFVD
jgi:RNA polymerase primary sigma factor